MIYYQNYPPKKKEPEFTIVSSQNFDISEFEISCLLAQKVKVTIESLDESRVTRNEVDETGAD
jgi:hypothetical protein